jgi:hypothetical protein
MAGFEVSTEDADARSGSVRLTMAKNSTTDKPSDGAIVERALSLANDAMFTVKLQHRRLRTDEPEDEVFFFRRSADFQFLARIIHE